VPGEQIESRDALNGVAKKFDPQRVFAVSRAQLDGVAAHGELVAITITSRRANRLLMVENRSRSISSLMLDSFSM
jgi:hypothetical protein